MKYIGFSTGSLAYGDFKRAIKRLNGSNTNAIELSALRKNELEPLVSNFKHLDLSQYKYISVHAPSKFNENEEKHIIKLLEKFIKFNIPIVVHPDSIYDYSRWRALGSFLLVENMDKRKPIGRTVEELQKIFDLLPESKLCFDIAHARQNDKTMHEACRILKVFGSRVAEIHISDVCNDSNHIRINNEAVKDFKKVARFIPLDVPIILEAPIRKRFLTDELNVAFASVTKRKRDVINKLIHRVVSPCSSLLIRQSTLISQWLVR
jgi:hypothetical protein